MRHIDQGGAVKRLLVIANLYHASPRIPGLLGPLAELGWQATVVTPPLDDDAEAVLGLPEGFLRNVEIAAAPYRGDVFWFLRTILSALGFSGSRSYTEQLKERVGAAGEGRRLVDGLMRAYQAVLAIPDTEWPWHRPAYKVVRGLLASRRFDAVLSSSPFPTVHLIAARVRRELPIAWIADFRDPWSQSHNYSLPKFRLLVDRWMEKRTLSGADLITTVSSGFAEKLSRLHGDRVTVIRNGYQPVNGDRLVTLPERFTVSYTGTIYEGKQDPTKILLAMSRLIAARVVDPARMALNFYGRYSSALQEVIAGHRLEAVAVQRGTLPRAEVRRQQRASHLLLLLQWEDPAEQGIFPLKLYEYLDAGRPILATGGARLSEIEEILGDTGAGSVAVSSAEIEQGLRRAYEDYIKDGKCAYHGDGEAISRYKYSACAQQLFGLLERLCGAARQQ